MVTFSVLLIVVIILLNCLNIHGTPSIKSFRGWGRDRDREDAQDALTTTNDGVNPYRHRVTLDTRSRYILEWEVYWKEKSILFNITVATNGYVGFGLSKQGKMSGSDIVVGGVDKNGFPYFSDRHAIGNQLPVLDESQDWTLHEAWERGALTFLSFSRPFDTCDSDGDLPIDDNLLSIIFAFGEKDNDIEYHFENKGTYDVYLLDPDLAPQTLTNPSASPGNVVPNQNQNQFTIRQEIALPSQETLYQCSFHRSPTSSKHHIIGFNTNFPSERDSRIVHHLLVYRCSAQPSSPAFQQMEQSSSSECDVTTPPEQNPCGELIHAWGFAGHPIFFPSHVGVPLSENGTEYFMLQVHYDNPNLITNITVGVSLDVFYTPTLRENDGSMMLVGGTLPGSSNIIIAPSSLNHIINAHCSPGCTERMFPEEGINIFGATLHTHISGRNMTLRHFREGKELPWILWDENYNPEFQNARLLRKEVKVMPGDHLVQRCGYDTTQREPGTVVRGGYGARDEMCFALIYYYSRLPGVSGCQSEIRTDAYRNLVNLTMSSSVSGGGGDDFDWSLSLREELRRIHLFEPQMSVCPINNGGAQRLQIFQEEAILPRGIPRWRPISRCEGRGRRGGKWASSYYEYY